MKVHRQQGRTATIAIAISLAQFLDRRGVDYELVAHPYALGGMRIAEAANIPGDQVVKPILLEDEQGYFMALVPATHRIQLGRLDKQLQRRLGLASDGDIATIFGDCEPGAMPALGSVYGVDVILDDSLRQCSDVYFEAGDHINLVHVSGQVFRELLADAQHGHFSRHL